MASIIFDAVPRQWPWLLLWFAALCTMAEYARWLSFLTPELYERESASLTRNRENFSLQQDTERKTRLCVSQNRQTPLT